MLPLLTFAGYVVGTPARYSTYTNSAGQIQDSSSHLTPFFEDMTGDFWTSDEVRSTETFGYAYPETANSTGANVTQQVVTAVNSLYSTTKDYRRDVSAPHREWIANIRVNKHALCEPFFIHIFLGPFDPDPFSWYFRHPASYNSHLTTLQVFRA